MWVPRPVWRTGVVAVFAAAVVALGTFYTPAPANTEADSAFADSILEVAAESSDVELGSTVAKPAAGVLEVLPAPKNPVRVPPASVSIRGVPARSITRTRPLAASEM